MMGAVPFQRMIAATGYYLRLLVYRQAVFPPALAYLGLVAAIYASPAGPPLSPGAVTSVALMPVSAWLARLAATAESAPFAEVSLVALGSMVRRQVARSAAALTVAVALGAAATLWGALANPAPYPPSTVIALLGMHVAEACAGAGVGALLAPPLHTRVGSAVAVVAAIVLASLLIPWLPPLNPLLRIGNQHTAPGPVTLLLVTAQAAAVGVAAATAAAAAIRVRRRA
jgi:hypothetical protein